jgi:hypothetical protein
VLRPEGGIATLKRSGTSLKALQNVVIALVFESLENTTRKEHCRVLLKILKALTYSNQNSKALRKGVLSSNKKAKIEGKKILAGLSNTEHFLRGVSVFKYEIESALKS